ncbi:MAG: LCP family protein [Clostridia bacterium]|nr:LCP family protein [Clostridia bacterium]
MNKLQFNDLNKTTDNLKKTTDNDDPIPHSERKVVKVRVVKRVTNSEPSQSQARIAKAMQSPSDSQDKENYEGYLFESSYQNNHESKSKRSEKKSDSTTLIRGDVQGAILEEAAQSASSDYDDYIYYKERYDLSKRGKHKHRHNDKNDDKNGKVKHKLLRSVLIIMLSLIVLVVGCFFSLRQIGKDALLKQSEKIETPDLGGEVISENNGHIIKYNGHTYEYNENITNILFIGVDKTELGAIDGVVGKGGQADAIYLAALDIEDGSIITFAIPRETMADIAVYSSSGSYLGIENKQICLSYAYGDGKIESCNNLISSLEKQFFGIEIQSFFAMDLMGINAMNDNIGGVDVTLDYDTVIKGREFKAGVPVHLAGSMAEAFVRTRSLTEVDANIKRMERQKIYLNAYIDKAIKMTKEDIKTPLNIYNAASDYSITSIDAASVTYLATRLIDKNITFPNIMRLPGEVKMGKEYAEFYVDEQEFYEMFLETYYNQIN